ncbi:DUF6668 family protein [Leifsonia shinshuensis]
MPSTGGPVLEETGTTAPILDLAPPNPIDRFGRIIEAEAGQLWLVSTHGGAGASTLGTALNLPAVTRAWPHANGHAIHVVLVCRSNLHGFESGRLAAREWASNSLPAVRVHGLIVVADAPGRLPKSLRQLEQHISGAVPRVWHIDWEEQLRTNPATPELAAGPWKSLAQQVQLLRKQVTEE